MLAGTSCSAVTFTGGGLILVRDPCRVSKDGGEFDFVPNPPCDDETFRLGITRFVPELFAGRLSAELEGVANKSLSSIGRVWAILRIAPSWLDDVR